jgi:hypothetical protein
MNELLNNPAIQSGILPFAIALISLLILRPLGWYWACLALMIAFYCGVYFMVGFQFTPLTSTRKIYLLGFAATALGLILDIFPVARRYVITLVAVLGAASALWVLWPFLSRKEGMDLWLGGIGALVYLGWLTALVERNRLAQPAIYAGVFAIGIGTGLSALLGASALLGQLGSSIGAATGAFILLSLFRKDTPTGTSFTFPAALLSGLIGISAVAYAQLPWYSLIMIAAIPVLLNLPLPSTLSKPKQLLIMCALTLALAIAAIGATWQVTGAPPI